MAQVPNISVANINEFHQTDEQGITYFRTLSFCMNDVYNDNAAGAGKPGCKLKFTQSHQQLHSIAEAFENFDLDILKRKIASVKQSDKYAQFSYFIGTIEKAIEGYPEFIENSKPTFNEYNKNLQEYGIKGDAPEEIKNINATKTFCELLLKFAPNNATATTWLKQTEQRLENTAGAIVYESDMHKSHMDQMLFSKKQIAIGNENEADFSSSFQAGDFIFATVYLPAKVRSLTNSYAANDVSYRINGSLVTIPQETAVWVTTPMQEQNVLQFAIVPNPRWLEEYGKYYADNKLRTHENIARALINEGAFSGIDVEVELSFRGITKSIKGSFTVDLSGGLQHLEMIATNATEARLSDQHLPIAGMNDANLEKQALELMTRKSGGSGKTYHKAIITSKQWDYNKSWAGVVTDRSITIVLVSKERDGQCMFQYFDFKQQAKGDGSFNDLLEFNGAGSNYYLSCKNAH